MTAIQRLRIGWTGFPGAPGVTTMYFTDAASSQGAVQTLLDSLVGNLPLDVTVQQEASGDIITAETGALTGTWTGTVEPPVQGLNPSVYAAPIGFQFQWLTNTVLDGHRVRGKTFVVPTATQIFDTNGTLTPAAVIALTDQGNAFLNTTLGTFLIWHRPRAARAADGSRPAVAARAGGVAFAIATRVPDKAIVLRSRRD